MAKQVDNYVLKEKLDKLELGEIFLAEHILNKEKCIIRML